jgi:sec-independent protein translocase protein TatC
VFICCLLAGFILSFPIFYGKWKFISPALYKNEKKNARHSSFFLRYFFLLSAVWLYIVIPMSVNFVATFKVSDLVLNQFTLDSYIGLVKRPFWQVDYFFYYYLFLDKTGISDSAFKNLSQIRYCTCSCRGYVTPPDVVSQTIVAIPMLLI